MAGSTSSRPSAIPSHHRLRALRHRTVAVVFGDRLGLTLFVSALLVYLLTWRVGVFITDTYAVANAMAAVADGHLYIESATYGPGLETPGMHQSRGRLYGRNYGQVVLSLPFLWALEAAAVVADPRVAVAAGWSLLLVAGGGLVGRATGHEKEALLGASVLALLAFAANAALATPLDPRWFPLMALQLGTMVAAGLAGVVLYRLVARIHGRRVGLAAGVAVALATPVAFWAPIPKRHVITTLSAAAVAYFLLRARQSGSLRFRALAYVPVGLHAWVHAAEGLLLLFALVVVDLATAEQTSVRDLATIAVALGLSMVPFVLTNVLISGDPTGAPRLLPNYPGGGPAELSRVGGSGTAGGVARGFPATIVAALAPVLRPLVLLGERLSAGLQVGIHDPDRLWQTFVRSGYIPEVAARDGTSAINLTVLESAPVLGAALALPVAAIRGRARTPAGAVDLFAALLGVAFTLLFLPNLPVHAQVTVRYLVPLYLLVGYGVVRLPSVRQVVHERGATLAWTYAASVLVGGQLFFAWLVARDAPLGEALQAHALVGLGLALAAAVWAVASESGYRRPRVGAVVLGLAAGAGTVLVLLSGLHHFAYAGDFALPMVP